MFDTRRLWCDCEKPWRPFLLKGRTRGDTGCPLRRPVGLSRCHLHTMWQTPLVWVLFTLPHPLPYVFLDKWVKTPARALPQARTETAWAPPVKASRSITSHLYPPHSATSPSFILLFRLRAFTAHFVTTRLLPRSRPDIRHMSPCRLWPCCLEPDVVSGLNWRTTMACPQQTLLCLILYFFMVLTEDIFIQNLEYQDNNVRTQLKDNSTLNIIDSINP